MSVFDLGVVEEVVTSLCIYPVVQQGVILQKVSNGIE